MRQWCQTDMGSQAAHLTAEESATGVLRVISSHSAADSGKFFVVDVPGKLIDGEAMYDGSARPW